MTDRIDRAARIVAAGTAATYAALTGPLAGQFLGFIHDEAFGTGGVTIGDKALGPTRRAHVDALIKSLRGQQARAWSTIFKTPEPEDFWSRGISCLSVESIALAHLFHHSGAKVVGSMAEAARYGEAVFTMLADDAALEEVMGQSGGLLQSLPAGRVHICAGTHGVHVIRKIDAAHAKAGQVMDNSVYVALNMYWEALTFELPRLPTGLKWHLFAHTGAPGPEDSWSPGTEPALADQDRFVVEGRAVLILVAKSGS